MARWLPRTSVKARGDTGRGGVVFRSPVRSYDSQWTNERAMREAMQRVTWIFRCVEAIASNQANLPLVFRKGDRETGPEIRNHPLYPVLNSRSNVGEDSHTFRHRMSAQLLLSSKGVFIEILRNRANEVLALILQPPDSVKPLKDPKKFVSGFEVSTYENGSVSKVTVKPENMIWLRKPHPFDPYAAITPLEAAGLAIETDWLARLYNRNFLINDGRPGGLIVVKGVMSDDDKEELRARYRGNINMAGRIGVIASDEGADFVDTAVNPRDAQYVEARNISKDEILMAYGVPQSVLANAAGRTFDNAEQERLIFWMETMKGTHLPLISRPLDVLDDDVTSFCAFDTSGVDVIQRAEIKRRDFILKEWIQGLITQNEYREETGRPKLIEGGQTLWRPSNYIPIGSTKKGEMKAAMDAMPQKPAPGAGDGGAIGRPQAPPDNQEGEDPEQDRPAGTRKPRVVAASAAHPSEYPEHVIPIRLRIETGQDDTKEAKAAPAVIAYGNWQVSAARLTEFKDRTLTDYERWETVIERTFQRFFERQQRVVTEKLLGTKTKRRWQQRDMELIGSLYDQEAWDKQLSDDVDPMIAGVMQEFGGRVSDELKASPFQANTDEAQAARDKQVAVILLMNATTKRDLEDILADGVTDGETVDELADKVTKMFGEAGEVRAPRAAMTLVVGAASAGKILAAEEFLAAAAAQQPIEGQDPATSDLTKTWVTMGDNKVRDTHDDVDGITIALTEKFNVGESLMEYPGDPTADPEEVINCRCALLLGTDAEALLEA